MKQNSKKSNLLASLSTGLGLFLLANPVSAQLVGPVNSVSELRDVSPRDWAYEALRNLSERYGCVRTYGDGSYKGNQPITRYEFAVGLNDCLQKIEQLIATSGTRGGENSVTTEDLEMAQRLNSEFRNEIALLSGKVNVLEGKVKTLEDQRFSTTTKLGGEVLFTLGAAFGGDKNTIQDNVTLSDRVRLNFDTSFTGKDRLRTRLTAGNFTSLSGATGTDMARLGHDQGGGNDVAIEDLYYRFPLGDKTRVWVGTQGLDLDDIFNVHNDYFESSGEGAMSRFGRRNPLVYRGTEGAGVGAKYKFNDNIALTGLYLAGNASDPTSENGLFDGSYSAGAQLDFNLGKKFDLGLTYVYGYQTGDDVNLSGSTSSSDAKRPFGKVGTSAHRLGLSGQYKATSNLSLGAWVGYANATAEEGADKGKNADILTWAANIALLDVGGEGNVLGLIFGQPPKLTGGDVTEDPDTAFLVEAQYRYKLTDNIMITPAVYGVFNPDHNSDKDSVWVGAVRTTFKF